MAKRIAELETTGKTYFIADSEVNNLYVKVLSTGRKSHVYRYKPTGSKSKREIRIGACDAITTLQARKRAKEIQAEVTLGTGVAAPDYGVKSKTFKDAGDRWISSLKALGRSAAYVENEERLLKLHIYPKIGSNEMADLKRTDFVNLMDAQVKAGKPDLARKVRSTSSMVMNYAVERGWSEHNVVATVKNKSKAVQKDRVLTKGELRIVKEELSGGQLSADTADVIRVLMHTGQRRGEVLGIPWSEIDFETEIWRLPGSRTKNKKSHNVPLSTQMIALFKKRRPKKFKPEDLVFNVGDYTVGQACRRMAARHEFPKFGPHDFRRTLSTSIQEIDQTFGDDMVEKIINHVGGRGAVAHYNHYKFDKEKRLALQAWSDWLDCL